MHRWYADDGLIGGKIEGVLGAARKIREKEAKINFILRPTKKKAYYPTQSPALLKILTDEFKLEMRLPADGTKTLGVPLGSVECVREFLLAKFDDIYGSIRLAVTIRDGRYTHYIHRVTASACRMTHLFRLIPPAGAASLWRELDAGQSRWFENMCDVRRPRPSSVLLTKSACWIGHLLCCRRSAMLIHR